MEPNALGGPAAPQFPADLFLAAADNTQPSRLRRSPSAFPRFPDSFYIWRLEAGREDRVAHICLTSCSLMLLAAAPLSHSLQSGLAAGVARVFCAVSFPAQHGEGSAVRDYLSRNRHYPIVQKEVLAPRAARVCLLAHLRHGCVADPGSLFLGDCYRVDRKAF